MLIADPPAPPGRRNRGGVRNPFLSPVYATDDIRKMTGSTIQRFTCWISVENGDKHTPENNKNNYVIPSRIIMLEGNMH
jgi:hypothetical protein